MKKSYFPLLVAGLAIIGLSLYLLNSKISLKVNPAESPKAQVLMKPDVFEPEILTIKKGTTVEFKNEDSKARWPASDLHPTHTIYPEFDPKEPIDPGKSWSFTFDKVGTWRDHDHLSPYIRGTVTVTE